MSSIYAIRETIGHKFKKRCINVQRYLTFITRFVRARQFGVRFLGMSHTRLPAVIQFRGPARSMIWPPEPLVVADFVNVVIDDDYGLRRLKTPPATIVDIGANIGIFTNWARDRFPDAIIHAYEPSPLTAAIARHNTVHTRTLIFEEGVASVSGHAEMLELGGSNLSQTIAVETGPIVLSSFETVVERIGGRIDLLKVDCEGAEWDFMRNTQAMAKVDRIRMEYHLTGDRTLFDVHKLASDLNFVVIRLIENDGFGVVWMDRC